jgi:hypothetical protein
VETYKWGNNIRDCDGWIPYNNKNNQVIFAALMKKYSGCYYTEVKKYRDYYHVQPEPAVYYQILFLSISYQ